MVKFVEFTREDKQRFFYSPEVCVAEMANFPNHSRLTTRMESLRVEGTPSEVVAKLQGGQRDESEAVKLLGRWNEWSGDTKRSEWLTLIDDTTDLLAKLKGGA